MNPTRTLIYKIEKSESQLSPNTIRDGFRYVYWKPTITKIVPPGKRKKYFFYWLFHFLGLFKNNDYSALLIYHGEVLASSLLIVPAYYKWPFMHKNDVQITYVLTEPAFRRKGLAKNLLRFAIQKTMKKDRCLWYVTNSENSGSINLCTKVGFEFYSYGKQAKWLRIIETDDYGDEEIL